jgi:hypothetical protein
MKSFQRTWKVENEPWRLATCLDCYVSTLWQTKTFCLLLSKHDKILISMSFSRWRGVSPLLPPSSPLAPSLQVPSICHHLRSVVSCLPSSGLVCELICEAECRPQGVWVKSSSCDLPHFDVYTKTRPRCVGPMNFRFRCSLGPGDLYLFLHSVSNLDVGEIEPSFSLIVCVYSIGLSRWNRAK